MAVKNRIAPAAAPCRDFGKQLIPLEFSEGYMIDMKSPESGNSHAACPTPQIMDARKHRKIARLEINRATVHEKCPRSHAPRNRPSARSTKKIVSARWVDTSVRGFSDTSRGPSP